MRGRHKQKKPGIGRKGGDPVGQEGKLRMRLRPAGKGSPIQAAEEADSEEVGKIGEWFRTLNPIGKGAPCKGLTYLGT